MKKLLEIIQKNNKIKFTIIVFFIILHLFGIVKPTQAIIDPVTATIAVATTLKKVSEMLEGLNKALGQLEGSFQEGQLAQMRQFALWTGDPDLINQMILPQAIRRLNAIPLVSAVNQIKAQINEIRSRFNALIFNIKPLDPQQIEYKENDNLRKVFSHEKLPEVKNEMHRIAIQKKYLDEVVMNLQTNYATKRLKNGQLVDNKKPSENGATLQVYSINQRDQLKYANNVNMNNISVKSCYELQKRLTVQTNEILLRLYEAQVAENQALAYQLSMEGYKKLLEDNKKLRIIKK